MAGVQTNSRSYTYKRSTSHYWKNGNIVGLAEWNDKGEKQSEWPCQYDNQPNSSALLLVSPSPDDAFSMSRNNVTVTKLDRYYTGLIDIGINPNRPTLIYNADGLLIERLRNYDNKY